MVEKRDAETSPDSIDILLVEDDEKYAESIAEVIEGHFPRFSTHITDDRANIVDLICSLDIDCVVSDYMMPTRDGLQILNHIRVQYPDIPFILITGEGDEQTASDAIGSGVTDYFIKGSDHTFQLLSHRIHVAVTSYRAQQAASEHQKGTETVLDSIKDAIIVTVDSGIAYVNEPGLQLMGADTVEDVLGDGVEEMLSLRNETGEELDGGLSKPHSDRVINAEVTTTEHGRIPVQLSQQEITWRGNSAVLNVLRRTDRELSLTADKLRQAVDDAPVGVTICEVKQEDYRVVYANSAFTSLTGYTLDDVRGESLSILHGEETDPLTPDEILQELDISSPLTVEEVNYTAEDEKFWNKQSTAALKDYDGRVTHLVTFHQDVTRRRQADYQIRRRQQALKNMYEAATLPRKAFDERIAAMLEAGVNLFGVDHAYLATVRKDDEGEQVVSIDASHGDHPELAEGSEYPYDGSYCQQVNESGGVVMYDAITDGWLQEGSFGRFRLGSYIACSIEVEGVMNGVVCFGGTLPRDKDFGAEDKHLIKVIGRWFEHEIRFAIRRQQKHTYERVFDSILSILEASIHPSATPQIKTSVGDQSMTEMLRNIVAVITDSEYEDPASPFRSWRQYKLSDLGAYLKQRVETDGEGIAVKINDDRSVLLDTGIIDETVDLVFAVARSIGASQIVLGTKDGSLQLEWHWGDSTSIEDAFEIQMLSLIAAAHGATLELSTPDGNVRAQFHKTDPREQIGFILSSDSIEAN